MNFGFGLTDSQTDRSSNPIDTFGRAILNRPRIVEDIIQPEDDDNVGLCTPEQISRNVRRMPLVRESVPIEEVGKN